MFPITTILIAVYQIIELTFLKTYNAIGQIIIAYFLDFCWNVLLNSSKRYTDLQTELNFWTKIHDTTDIRIKPPIDTKKND